MDKNPEKIQYMFDSIASNYDKMNAIISLGMHYRVKKDVIESLKINPSSVLDLCCGTGDMCEIVSNKFKHAKITGVDFSSKMLDIAREKHKNINFVQADCTKLPFEDNSFDLCIISFGLRNIENRSAVLEEISRVCKSQFVCLDLSKPNRFFNLFLMLYMKYALSFFAKIFNKNVVPYQYLEKSNVDFPCAKDLAKEIENYGFCCKKIKNYLFGQLAAEFFVKG